MSLVPTIILQLAFDNLQEWLKQAREYNSGKRIGSPDHSLLLPGIDRVGDKWGRPRPLPTMIEDLPEGACVRVAFNKPNNEGVTVRRYDPAAIFIIAMHCVVGGGFTVEPYGEKPKPDDTGALKGKYFYYAVLRIHGQRIYAIRLVVGTGSGLLTREDDDFHDQRRTALGRLEEQSDPDDPMAYIGREEAINRTCEAIRKAVEAGQQLPSNLTEERVRAMLQEGYELLDKLWPLGVPIVKAAAE